MGTTKLIAEELTEYMPQAAPRIETETPFSSIGRAGANFNSEALDVITAEGARLTLALIRASSPADNPGAMRGPGLPVGLGLGEGVGLPLELGGAAATGIRLAPVS